MTGLVSVLLIVGERKERLRPPRYSLPSYGRDICRSSLSWVITMYLGTGRVLADEDEEDKAAPEEINTTNDPKDKLSVGDALNVLMIPMDKVVNTFKYPQNSHHYEQLGVKQLQIFIVYKNLNWAIRNSSYMA